MEEDNAIARAVTWCEEEAETENLMSFCNIVNFDTKQYPGSIVELEAATQTITSSPKVSSNPSESPSKATIEVN